MTYIFNAECKKTTMFVKTLIELMSNISIVENIQDDNKYVKQLYMKITKEGLEFFSNTQKIITCFVILNQEFFSEYSYKDEEPLCIGISLDILKTCFKNIRKFDVLKMSIMDDEYKNFPDTMSFIFNNTKGFSVKFNIVQNIDNIYFENYKDIAEIPSNRITNLHKEIGGKKKNVKISIQNKLLTMTSTMVDIAENWVSFPTKSVISDKLEMTIKSEYFKTVSKISYFNTLVNFLVNNTNDILLKSDIVNVKVNRDVVGVLFVNISLRHCKNM